MPSWFPSVVAALAKGDGDEFVFGFSYASFLVVFDKARRRLGLPPMVPYEARHSGPAIDVARGHRSRAEVRERGRWKTEKSVVRYEQRARLAMSYQRLPAALQAHFDKCEAHLGDVLLGRMAADAQILAAR